MERSLLSGRKRLFTWTECGRMVTCSCPEKTDFVKQTVLSVNMHVRGIEWVGFDTYSIEMING